MGYFEKRKFSSIPTAEVLKKPKSQSEKMIPTQGGKHCCWQGMEKRQHHAPPVHSKQAKVSKSCGHFQKSKFSSIPTAEVSKKTKMHSHRTWGSNKNTLPMQHGNHNSGFFNPSRARTPKMKRAIYTPKSEMYVYEKSEIAIFH